MIDLSFGAVAGLPLDYDGVILHACGEPVDDAVCVAPPGHDGDHTADVWSLDVVRVSLKPNPYVPRA